LILTLALSLIALFVLTAPIWIALIAPVLIVVLTGPMRALPETVIAKMFTSLDIFTLMAMPFFIFAANIMTAGGMARRLVRWAVTLVGTIKGGLGVSTQVACLAFGSVSGSTTATVAAVGGLMYPAMVERHYPFAFNAGLISTTASVAVLIPPSIAMIVYGALTGTSIGALFMAGITAGLVFGMIQIVYILWYAHKHDLPTERRTTWKEFWEITWEASWALGMPVLILGGIYTGIFTPTEASAVSAIYAIVVSLLVYREMDLKGLYRTCLSSAIVIGEVMLLTASAATLGWMLTLTGGASAVGDLIMSVADQPWKFLLLINVLLLITGCFVDGVPALVIVAPLFHPLATTLGIDPVHFGIVLTANNAIGMFTPPFGLNLLVSADITKKPILELLPGCVPFFWVSLIGLAVLTYVPEISLWLPRLLYR